MKRINLPIEADLSEFSLNDAEIEIRKRLKIDDLLLFESSLKVLKVSPWDLDTALNLMLKYNLEILITRQYREYEWSLISEYFDYEVYSPGA